MDIMPVCLFSYSRLVILPKATYLIWSTKLIYEKQVPYHEPHLVSKSYRIHSNETEMVYI